ncbi:hypothetical protein F4677DRAFT_138161 [Hypoxylon crocopeplum]|nr:hypothetical protein F4677DRAFT_138161 [Hypoxylon crocopeplum]
MACRNVAFRFLGRARRESRTFRHFRKQLANYSPANVPMRTCPIFIHLPPVVHKLPVFFSRYSLALFMYCSSSQRSRVALVLLQFWALCSVLGSILKNARIHRKEKTIFFCRQSFRLMVDAMARSMGMTEKRKSEIKQVADDAMEMNLNRQLCNNLFFFQ